MALEPAGRAGLEQRLLVAEVAVNDEPLHGVAALLDAAPQARVVATYLGMGKMGLLGLPQDRVYVLNPGQTLDVGDRRLRAVLLPTFDAPETTGLFEERARALFSADCFGAVQERPLDDLAAVDPAALRAGMRRLMLNRDLVRRSGRRCPATWVRRRQMLPPERRRLGLPWPRTYCVIISLRICWASAFSS